MNFYTIKRIVFDGLLFGYFFVAILLAVFRPGEEQMLLLGQNTLIFLACSGVGAFIGLVLLRFKISTLGEMLFAPAHTRQILGPQKPWYQRFWGIQTLVALALTIGLGIVETNFDIKELLAIESIQNASRLFVAIAQPDWGLLPQAVLKIIETIFIAFMATVIAVPVAFVLSFLCAKNLMGTTPVGYFTYMVLRTLFNISRSIEPILWAIIFSVWVGFGPFAGMLALMIHSVASLAKQYSEMVESVDDGPIEGIRSTGANFPQTIWFAIVPQVILPYISFTIYRWDINVRMATIIGFVGGGGIGELLLQYQRLSQWPQVGTIIVVIAVIVWLMDNFSAYVREAVK